MRKPNMTVLGSAAFASGCYLGAIALEQQFTFRPNSIGASLIVPAVALWWPLIVVIGAICAFVAFLFQASKQAAVVFALIPLVAFFYVFVRAPCPVDDHLLRFAGSRSGGRVGFIGEVESAPTTGKLIIEPILMEYPRHQRLSGKTAVIIYGGAMPASPKPGLLLRVRGRINHNCARKFSWEPDFTIKSIRDGVYTVCFARADDVQCVERLDGAAIRAAFDTGGGTIAHELRLASDAIEKKWTKYWTDVRCFIVDSHCRALGEAKGRLLSSIVIGDRAVDVDKAVKDQFRTVGLSHLLAASGFNLSILVGCVYFLSRFLFKSRIVNCAFGSVATVFFVCLAGPSPSVVRAAIMCLLLLAARAFFSRVRVFATLAATLILALLVDPLSVADVGLQMSYAATASIICGARPLAEFFKLPLSAPARRLSDGCADLAAVILLAQAGVLPLQLVCFWVLGLLFLPANFLVDPIIAPITICGFISSALALLRFTFQVDAAPFGVVEKWLDWLVSALLDYMLFLSGKLVEMPLASINVGPPASFSIIGYYLAFAFFISTLRSKHTAVLGLSIFVCGLFLLLWRPQTDQFIAFDGDAMLSPCLGFVAGTGQESWHLERIKKYTGLNGSRFLSARTGDMDARGDVVSHGDVVCNGELVWLESRFFSLLARKRAAGIGPIESQSTIPMIAQMRAKGERPILIWVRGRSTFFQTNDGVTVVSSSKKGKPLVLACVEQGTMPAFYQMFCPFKRIERNRGSPFIELR